MQNPFNLQDVKNMQIFLNRVNIQGNESMAHAELLIKCANLQAMMENGEPPPPIPEPPQTPADEGNGQQEETPSED
ncbi:MAG: hypothetical protein GY815_12960 [Gammaproteobacteria bacterium]|nr:hypothetical protein [Gammaproteobacteria bacterium]